MTFQHCSLLGLFSSTSRPLTHLQPQLPKEILISHNSHSGRISRLIKSLSWYSTQSRLLLLLGPSHLLRQQVGRPHHRRRCTKDGFKCPWASSNFNDLWHNYCTLRTRVSGWRFPCTWRSCLCLLAMDGFRPSLCLSAYPSVQCFVGLCLCWGSKYVRSFACLTAVCIRHIQGHFGIFSPLNCTPEDATGHIHKLDRPSTTAVGCPMYTGWPRGNATQKCCAAETGTGADINLLVVQLKENQSRRTGIPFVPSAVPGQI